MATNDDFKAALSSWASGVTVVTTKSQDLVYGLTVSAFASLSLDPQLIMVSINDKSQFLGMVKESNQFAVSILAREQEPISNFFAKSGREPARDFGEIGIKESNKGLPIIEGSVAHLACTVHAWLDQGDHMILVGAVDEAGSDESKKPLLYYRRGYRSIEI